MTGSQDIHIAVANIDSPLLPYAKLSERLIDGVGSWFLTNPLRLVLADGHLYRVAEEMTTEFLCGSHHLIAYHRQTATFGLERLQRLDNAVIRLGGIERVLHIMFPERLEGSFKLRVVSPLGNRPFHQHADTIANEAANIIQRVFGHPVGTQRIISRSRQIAKSIQQRTVKVKYVGLVSYRLLRVIIVRTLLLYLSAFSSSSIVRCIRYFQ